MTSDREGEFPMPSSEEEEEAADQDDVSPEKMARIRSGADRSAIGERRNESARHSVRPSGVPDPHAESAVEPLLQPQEEFRGSRGPDEANMIATLIVGYLPHVDRRESTTCARCFPVLFVWRRRVLTGIVEV